MLRLQPGSDGFVTVARCVPEAEERLDENAPDAIVTANVVFAATRVGLDVSELLGALEDHVSARGLGGIATTYYDSPAIRAYYLARAVAPASFDGPTARMLRQFLENVAPESLDVVDVAAALAAAALLGVESAAGGLTSRLLATAEAGGGWPEARWFTDPAGYTWRSEAFSNALAVEALVLT